VGVTRRDGNREIYRGVQFGSKKTTTMQTAIQLKLPTKTVQVSQTSRGLNVNFSYNHRIDGLRIENYQYDKTGKWIESSPWYRDGVLTEAAQGLQVHTFQ